MSNQDKPYIHDEGARNTYIVKCPSCGASQGDLWEYRLEGEDSTATTCGECGNEFVIRCHTTVEYSSAQSIKISDAK